MAARVLMLVVVLGALLSCGSAFVQDSKKFPARPQDQLEFASGYTKYLYAVKNDSQFFFRLRSMPGGVTWFQIRVDEKSGKHLVKVVAQAAEENWEIGIYYLPGGVVDAIYALVPNADAGH